MNISPVRLNFNVLQQKRQNVAQKDKLPQLASDSISFSAKIPENIKAEIKYGKLVDKEGEGIKISHSDEPEILDLVVELKDDEKVSDKKKAKLLLSTLPKYPEVTAFYQRAKRTKYKSRTDEQKEFDRSVVKAMLDAAPSDEVKNKMLFTHSGSEYYGYLPIHVCDFETMKLLLDASCDESVRQKQLTTPDEYKYGKKNVFWHNIKNPEVLKYILESCDEELQKKLVWDSKQVADYYYEKEDFNMEKFAEILEAFPKEETAIDMLVENTEYLHKNPDRKNVLDFYIKKFENYPAEFKKILLTKGGWNNTILIKKCEKPESCKKLILASPDEETRRTQLFESKIFELDFKNAVDYLFMAPTEKDFRLLLGKTISAKEAVRYKYSDNFPIIGLLSFDQHLDVIGRLKTAADKKAYLLMDWQEPHRDTFGDLRGEITTTMDEEIKRGTNTSSFDVSAERKEAITKILLDVIEDDSTTSEEALELINKYIETISDSQKEAFKEMQEYFKEQV